LDAPGGHGLPQAIVDPAMTLPGMDDGVGLAAPASTTAPAAAPVPAMQIAMQLARGVGGNALVVSLSPEELGGVEIKLELDEEGRTHARIAVERPTTLELIQRDAPMLERALQAAGLDLAPNALSFDLRQDGHASQQRRDPSPITSPVPTRPADAVPLAEPPLLVSRLLDLRV
jgi:flagellar hook-length control protein FliK